MNWVDLLVLGVAALSAAVGFARGFVREVLGVGAWVGAAIVTALAFVPASAKARTLIANPEIADALAVGVVFIVTLIVLSFIASWVGGLVRHSALGGLDRMLGLFFGLARAAFFVIVAYIVIGLVEVPTAWPPPVRAARGLPYAYAATSWAVHLLPPPYRPRVVPPPSAAPRGVTAQLQARPEGAALDPSHASGAHADDAASRQH